MGRRSLSLIDVRPVKTIASMQKRAAKGVLAVAIVAAITVVSSSHGAVSSVQSVIQREVRPVAWKHASIDGKRSITLFW
jgi:hypothetical protein